MRIQNWFGKLTCVPIFFLVSCAAIQDLTNTNKGPDGYVSNGAQIQNVTSNKGTTIEYQSPEFLEQKLIKEAELKKWDQKTLEERKKYIPEGGNIILNIERLTLGAANTQYFTLIVEENNKEIFRKAGADDIPNYSNDGWWNTEHFYLPKKITSTLSVYVVDEVQQKRFEYRITPANLIQKN